MPLFDLLHFGTGTQAIHYFFFCLVAILGTMQAVAAHYQRCELLWFEGLAGYFLGGAGVASGFVWFFLSDDEVFTPGLAGAELFIVFAGAFLVAVLMTKIVAFCLNRLRLNQLRSLSPVPATEREEEPLT